MLVQSLIATDIVYTFGFGSNMNIDNVINKKGLRVKDHCCASLPGEPRDESTLSYAWY